MIELTIDKFLILCPLIFLSAFVDAVAGGGGVISLPAYLFIGLPSHYALGSNKFSAFCSSIFATVKYITSGNINIKAAIWSAVGAMAGAAAGSSLALYIPESALKTIMLVALPVVAIVLIVRKDNMMKPEKKDYPHAKTVLISVFIGVSMGIYDGMVGPGTGTFMIMMFSAMLGYDLLTAGGCAKLSNLASNLGSLFVLILSGKVVYALAIPAAICGAFGARMGAKFAIKGGSKNIRYFMFIVLGLLFVKFAIELFA